MLEFQFTIAPPNERSLAQGTQMIVKTAGNAWVMVSGIDVVGQI